MVDAPLRRRVRCHQKFFTTNGVPHCSTGFDYRYYQTRTETAIPSRTADLVELVGAECPVDRLGSGRDRKLRVAAGRTAPACLCRRRYLQEFLLASTETLAGDYHGCRSMPPGVDFSNGLDIPQLAPVAHKVAFFPALSIAIRPADAVCACCVILGSWSATAGGFADRCRLSRSDCERGL